MPIMTSNNGNLMIDPQITQIYADFLLFNLRKSVKSADMFFHHLLTGLV